MHKFILMPDSFKGTMSSMEVCRIMQTAVEEFYPDAGVAAIPVADGGEGTVDCFLSALGGSKVSASVSGPHFDKIDSFYGVLPDKTAVVEMAACAGLPLAGGRRNPESTTTYGVGELIAHAARSGCRKIILGLGGSATNDGGAGAAAALGIRFFDGDSKEFVPTGATLGEISRIEAGAVAPDVRDADITIMCDINNPLYGGNGAAYVYGPQKGADASMVERLDAGLKHYAKVILRDTGIDVRSVPGSGAAGGMGAGMLAFFKAGLQMGIEAVLDTVGFDDIAKDASMIFSGEGKIDSQSLRGKVVAGVAARAKKAGVPLIAVVGDIADDIEPIYGTGVAAVFSINRKAVPFSKARLTCKSDLLLTMRDILRYSKALHPRILQGK